jgi:PAS domain S-box-containing protein
VELTGQEEHRDDDSPRRMLGTALDVTERKRGEDALRESEQRFRALVNASSDIVFRTSGDWSEMLQLEGRGFIADTIRPNENWLQEYIHPDDQRLVLDTIRKAVGTKSLFELEHRVQRTDGTVGWTFSRAVPLLNAKSEITEWFGAASDITDRKRAEERERQITAEAIAANAKFRALFEQTNVFAGIMTKDGVVMEVNRACLDVCGYRAEEVLGRLFWDTPWWRNFPESQQNIRAATPIAAHGVPYRETLHYSWADGTERLMEFALYPIVDEAGKILFLHPTGVDITDLKRAEENYRQLAETLETEVRARTLELENRNVEVLRQSDLLREFSQRLLQAQDEERRRIARELHDSAGQTLTVLGLNLAQFAQQIDRDAPGLTPELKSINDTVQQLHREIRTTSYLLHPPLLDETGLSSALHWYVQGLQERSDLQIDLAMSPDFGRVPREMELVVFRLVQECLTNIHRHAGSKTATIRIERNSQALTVEVRDQGKGMPSRKLAEVQTGGSGVGIRGMHERLRQFKGKLTIQSDSSGTRVCASIPIPEASRVEQEGGNAPLKAVV